MSKVENRLANGRDGHGALTRGAALSNEIAVFVINALEGLNRQILVPADA